MGICKFVIKGMNNVLDPSLLPYRSDYGFVQELVTEVTNCDVKTPHGVKMRKGCSTVLDAPITSGWSDNEIAYLVSNGTLCSFDGETLTEIAKLTSNNRASFCKVNDVVVMSNGSDYLVIENGVATIPVVQTDPFKVNPPAGQVLCFFNGRLYIASGNMLCCCDTYSVDSCDERQFIVAVYNEEITMVAAVERGLFVGTNSEVYFLEGSDPYVDPGFSQKRIASYGAIAGTSIESDGNKVSASKFDGKVVVFASTKGICVGSNDGSLLNLSDSMVEYKHDHRGSAMLREENGEIHYVVSFPQTFSEENVYVRPSFDIDEQEIQ